MHEASKVLPLVGSANLRCDILEFRDHHLLQQYSHLSRFARPHSSPSNKASIRSPIQQTLRPPNNDMFDLHPQLSQSHIARAIVFQRIEPARGSNRRAISTFCGTTDAWFHH